MRHALDDLEDWGPAGTRPGQYRLDLAADGAALPRAARRRARRALGGIGHDRHQRRWSPGGHRPRRWLDQCTPGCPLLLHQYLRPRRRRASGRPRREPGQWGALRRRARPGGRARRGALRASGCEELGSAIVGISGFPGRSPGWGQFRALGAASLECCAVAEGVLDAYLVVGGSTLYVWDYAGRAADLPGGGCGGGRARREGTGPYATPRHAALWWRQRLRWSSAWRRRRHCERRSGRRVGGPQDLAHPGAAARGHLLRARSGGGVRTTRHHRSRRLLRLASGAHGRGACGRGRVDVLQLQPRSRPVGHPRVMGLGGAGGPGGGPLRGGRRLVASRPGRAGAALGRDGPSGRAGPDGGRAGGATARRPAAGGGATAT